MWIGKNMFDKTHVGGMSWPDRPIKALGVYFGQNKEDCSNLNWDNKLTACQHIIDNWSKRTLTLYGKVQIIKNTANTQIHVSVPNVFLIR